MNTDTEFQNDCQCLAARAALSAAESMPLSQRVMIYRGIIALLPPGTEARSIAETASKALENADRAQLRLFEILDADS